MKQSKVQQAIPISSAGSIISGAAMPAAVDVERPVLGVIMIEASPAAASAILVLTKESFFDPAHAMIFEAMRAVEDKGGKIDLYTVGEQLKISGRLAAIGGMAYLTELTQAAVSGAHIEHHVQILLQMQAGRHIAQSAYSALSGVLTGEEDIADIIDELSDKIDSGRTIGLQGGNIRPIAGVAQDAMAALQERQKRALSGLTTGVPTGLKELDRITSGWQGGELIVLAARPAMGKTAIALHLLVAAAKSNVPVVMFSLEMTGISLYERLLLSQCNAYASNVKSGNISPQQWNELNMAKVKLDALSVSIDDKSGVSVQYIATHAKILARQGKCGMIVIDYLQLIDARGKGFNREQEVAYLSKTLKNLAKDLNIPIILLAQLSRAVEGRDGVPRLSDLRESGAIEQDADLVVFIHRAEYYDKKHSEIDVRLSNGVNALVPIKGLGALIIAKNRNGATGSVKFNYNSSMDHFADFDETPYLAPASVGYSSGGACGGRGSTVSDRPVSSGSINYVAPAAASASDDLPF